MTKQAALQQFFSDFGLTAYPANAVPSETEYPWITYEATSGDWDGQEIGISVDIWYHTESEKEPNAKAQQIADAIGLGGVMIACDNGAIWIKRGSPWCQNLTDASDDTVKRRSLNVTLEFFTL